MIKPVQVARGFLTGSAVVALSVLAACQPSNDVKDTAATEPGDQQGDRTNGAVAETSANAEVDAVTQQAPSQSEIFRCGGDTTRAAVDQYFTDLKIAIAQEGQDSRFNRFVGQEFGLRTEQGKTLSYNLADFVTVTPGKITREEWQQISKRGADKLQDAGWRGCFLDNGKVWFEATDGDGLKLKLIARDMPWVEPAQ